MNINSNIIYLGKHDFRCSFCTKAYSKSPQYQRTSIITKLKCRLCKLCALKEGFGSKYKQNSKYKRWIIKTGE